MEEAEKEFLYKRLFAGYPDVVNVMQLKEMTGLSRQFIYHLLQNHEIPAFRIANSYRFAKVSVIDYVIRAREEFDEELERKSVPAESEPD